MSGWMARQGRDLLEGKGVCGKSANHGIERFVGEG